MHTSTDAKEVLDHVQKLLQFKDNKEMKSMESHDHIYPEETWHFR